MRKRFVFTIAILCLCRVAANISCPGVDPDQLEELFKRIEEQAGTGQIAMMLNMFTGGAMQKFAVAALGIMPYITASIIMSLLTPVLPALEKWKREGETGYQKITQNTRYLTLVICVIQGWMFAVSMENPGALVGSAAAGIRIVSNPGFAFRFQTVIILTSGTMILMWLGEQITEKGIGQGASLIITIGIINRLPAAIYSLYGMMRTPGPDQLTIIHGLILLTLFALVTAATVTLSVGVRRVPIQYARARAGRGGVSGGGGQSSFFPLRVNYANVMPIIFASTLLTVPPMLLRYLGGSSDLALWLRRYSLTNWVSYVAPYFQYGTQSYMLVYGALVLFFCFFWVASQFNPLKVADDLKRSNAYIPGYHPGEETAAYLDWTMTRVTTAGAVFLTFIALLPMIFSTKLNVPFLIAGFFGGTSLLIMVGVLLDTLRQIESHILTHGGYETFMRSGRMRGRRRR